MTFQPLFPNFDGALNQLAQTLDVSARELTQGFGTNDPFNPDQLAELAPTGQPLLLTSLTGGQFLAKVLTRDPDGAWKIALRPSDAPNPNHPGFKATMFCGSNNTIQVRGGWR